MFGKNVWQDLIRNKKEIRKNRLVICSNYLLIVCRYNFHIKDLTRDFNQK